MSKNSHQSIKDNSTANQSTIQVSKRLARFVRRIQHLPPGRHQLLVSVEDKHGVVDWSVRSWGKVEKL